ncbi:MAG: hypothetical protein IJG57_04700 [Firmicutes bacterium]|nr:hypothetical protein [Bacillota bacterium]
MEKVFMLRISDRLFEPVKKNSNVLEMSQNNVRIADACKVGDLYLSFAGYIMEDGVPVGARFHCDYGVDNRGMLEMRSGETAHFSYEGTSVDDEGDPEDFSIDYYLELLEWDDEIMEMMGK